MPPYSALSSSDPARAKTSYGTDGKGQWKTTGKTSLSVRAMTLGSVRTQRSALAQHFVALQLVWIIAWSVRHRVKIWLAWKGVQEELQELDGWHWCLRLKGHVEKPAGCRQKKHIGGQRGTSSKQTLLHVISCPGSQSNLPPVYLAVCANS